MTRNAAAAWIGLLVTCLGCEVVYPPVDLPDDQLVTSPNFRYHARADAVLDPTIVDRLERYRAGFNEWLGVTNSVIDYYRFRDQRDLKANSGCPKEADACAGKNSVSSAGPFHEHELVHALLGETGDPPGLVVEGIAQWAACLEPARAPPIALDRWRSTFLIWPMDYTFGQRLVGWMLEQAPPAVFIEYYRTAIWTRDPAVFMPEFQQYWGRPLDDDLVALINDRRFSRSGCACRAPLLPTDGSEEKFVARQDYRVLEASEDSRVELSNAGSAAIVPGDCSGADALRVTFLTDSARPMLSVGRLGPGRYAVRTLPDGTGTVAVTSRQEPFGDASCEAAASRPIMASGKDVTIWVDHRFAADLTWFSLAVEGPQLASASDQATVLVCPACGSFCTHMGPGVIEARVPPPPSGRLLVAIQGMDNSDAAVTFRAAP